ncbi:MAG TPA: hypothetical protein ENJ95_03475 [Bacteroidetes bacterium]|nr:hypothetical protein [Bacteroidota bacterium]
MLLIRELLDVSGYRPEGGYSLDMLGLVNSGLGRSEALAEWVGKGKSKDSFYKTYKSLKDNLICSGLKFKGASPHILNRMEVWEKYKAVKQLILGEKKGAAMELAIEVVQLAKKVEFLEVVVGMASDLEHYFGGVATDTRRYLRYRGLRKQYSSLLQDEMGAKSLQTQVAFYIKRKKDLSGLAAEMEELENKKTGSVMFMRYRFSALSMWFEKRGEIDRLKSAFRETIRFYDECKLDVAVSARTNLYFRLTPYLVQMGRFAEAGTHISRGLQTTVEGTHNWHALMLQRACLGFVSGKPGVALGSWRMAQAVEKIYESREIDEGWGIVRKYCEVGVEKVGFEVIWEEVFG